MKKTIKSTIKSLGFFLFPILVFISCEKDVGDNSQEGKLMNGKVNLLDPRRYGCAEFSPEYLKSIPDEYRAQLSLLHPDLTDSQKSIVNTAALPTTQQRTWAAGRKSNGWFYVNTTSVDDIKYYLSQNYPVAASFDVNQSFYDARNYNYVWSSLYGSRQGGHCVCIVGYNDTTRQFKVQNSWGSGW